MCPGSAQDGSGMLYDYKGRPRMVSSEQGMVAADQGDCSALGRLSYLHHIQCCMLHVALVYAVTIFTTCFVHYMLYGLFARFHVKYISPHVTQYLHCLLSGWCPLHTAARQA